jgi:PKD repeat protein
VSILATPSGSNFQTANPQTVDIRLVPTGVILPAAGSPKAAFTVSPASPTANTPAQFDASTSCGSTDAANACTTASAITSYVWNFGDGGTASGKVVSHTFSSPQQYSVTLTVTNDRGLSASTTNAVSVGAGSLPTSAQFRFSPASPAVNQTVFFDASEAKPGTGHTLTQYKWQFGDGTSGSGMLVSHAYGIAGGYSVTLTVVDETGQQLAASQTVTVTATATPAAVFTISQSPVPAGTPVTFDGGRSTPGAGATAVVRWEWDFGDGTPIDGRADGVIVHTFSSPGAYAVKLRVTDSNGASGSTSKVVTVQ